jgi:tRNA(adenine34) deaminase
MPIILCMGLLFSEFYESIRMDHELDKRYMKMALEEAKKASRGGEVPVGAVLLKNDQVIAQDHNRCMELNDPTAHAEILVLRKGGKILKNYRLKDTVMYVTTEPCPMCVSAMLHARISRVVFGTLEPKFGAVKSKFNLLNHNELNHKIKVEWGILERECAEVLKRFFRKRRQIRKKGDVGLAPLKKTKESRGSKASEHTSIK